MRVLITILVLFSCVAQFESAAAHTQALQSPRADATQHALRLRGGVNKFQYSVADATIDRVIESVRKEKCDEGKGWMFAQRSVVAEATSKLAYVAPISARVPVSSSGKWTKQGRVEKMSPQAHRESNLAVKSKQPLRASEVPDGTPDVAASVVDGLKLMYKEVVSRLQWKYLMRPRRLRPTWKKALSSVDLLEKNAIAQTKEVLAKTKEALQSALNDVHSSGNNMLAVAKEATQSMLDSSKRAAKLFFVSTSAETKTGRA